MRKYFGGALLGLVLLLLTGSAGAQTISAGSIPAAPNFGFNPSPVAITAVDLAYPATGSGSMTSATFVWSVTPCPATVKIKFFRRSSGVLLFLAERGPFDVTANTQTVVLSPAVPVQVGDLVGIARVAGCGSPAGQSPGGADGLVAFGADVSTNVTISSGTLAPNSSLAVVATGTGTPGPPGSESLVGVIPVAISSPGLQGSNFKTAVQLVNPTGLTLTGRLVFHPQGTTGTAADPSLAYTLGPGQIQYFADLPAAMGQSGIGSFDVMATQGSPSPSASIRVYSDGGLAGTTGFTEDIMRIPDALGAGARGVLVGPFDTAVFRSNVGVRTLSGGAAIVVTVRDSIGNIMRTFTRVYAPSFFQQTDIATFLGVALGANQSVTIEVFSGSLFIYVATADNRTNDPAIQFARNVL